LARERERERRREKREEGARESSKRKLKCEKTRIEFSTRHTALKRREHKEVRGKEW
jgi:hypothetical protein